MSDLAQAASIELTEQEMALREKILGNPLGYPSIMKAWLLDHQALNGSDVPISQVIGFDRLLFSRGTTFPTGPAHEQNFTYVFDATNGVNWHFRYNSLSASAYKWEAVGPTEASAFVNTVNGTTSVTYVDLGAGPSITVPLAGDYLIKFGMQATSTTGINTGVAAPKKGAAATSDDDSCVIYVEAGVATGSASRQLLFTGMAASDVIKMQYRNVGAANIDYQRRWLFVSPVRVAG